VGRCLDRVAAALDTNLMMDVVAHVVAEFDLSLDELHNGSTTVTFCGDHETAQTEQTINGHAMPATRRVIVCFDFTVATRRRPMPPREPVACSGRCRSSRNFVTACIVLALAFASESKSQSCPGDTW
jgi:hypothetical protein